MGDEKIVLGVIIGAFFAWVAFKIYIWADKMEKEHIRLKQEKNDIAEKSFYKDMEIKSLKERADINSRRK
jgi:hypothetical protein